MHLSSLKLQIEKLKRRVRILEEAYKEKCPHPQLKKSGGGYWLGYPEHDKFKNKGIHYTCLDCGRVITFSESNYSLDERVVKDTSTR